MNRTRARGQVSWKMTVPMTDDQPKVLIATMRGVTDGDQRMDLLRSWAGAELAEPWEKEVRRGCKATREEEAAVPTHTWEREVESTEMTPHKLDQVRPGTREGEVAVQTHTCERVGESTELTQLGQDTEATREEEMNKIRLKLDRMWPGTREWEVAMQAYTYEQDIAGYLSPLLQFYPCPGEKLDYVICLWRTHLL